MGVLKVGQATDMHLLITIVHHILLSYTIFIICVVEYP